MKKIVCILFAGIILAFTGCGSSDSGTGKGAKTVDELLSSGSAESSSSAAESSSSQAEESSSQEQSSQAQPTAYDKIDTDLSAMSDTMAYAEYVNMINAPDKYTGKVVKAKGFFAVSNDNGNTYFACMLTDATACCSQPLEFVLSDTSRKYPADYPAVDSEITVVGKFGMYTEGANRYFQLADAQLL